MKTKICDVARRLFNERGYRAVSMRAIAAEAGISLGTLTYHYAQKQALLQDIMEHELQVFPQQIPEGVAGVHSMLYEYLQSLVDVIFYHNDPSIYKDIPSIYEQHRKNVTHLYDVMCKMLATQVASGYMTDDLTGERIKALVGLLMSSHIGWVQHNFSWQPDAHVSIDAMMKTQWAALWPYLTEKGKREYNELAVMQ